MKKKLQTILENVDRLTMRGICYVFIFVFCILCNSSVLAQQPTLYGLTSNGGTNGNGVLFAIPTGSTSTSQLYSFAATTGTAANGSVPYGSLLHASNGKLYGMASAGSSGGGVIFEYDASLSTYSLMFSFGGTSGAGPTGALIQASNGKLYGMTSGGGASIYGVLFEYDLSTYTYTKKVDFLGLNGASPYGSLIQASNGKLYGMTNNGGANYFGNIFEYDISTNTYSTIYSFNSTNGKYPYGSLIQASNGKLYGMASDGGANNSGVIFEYNLSTSTYTTLVDFNGTGYGANPRGSLLQASNSKLYGLTMYGGTSNAGTMFEYDFSNSTFTKIVDFTGTNGQGPQGSLMQASNSKLYGMTYQAGASSFGTLFEYDYSTSTFATKLNFNATNGGFPAYGHLIELNPCAVTGTVTKTNVTCNGAANGSATVTAGGTGPYTYSWSVSGGTASSVASLSPGTYTVVITGAYSCTATKTINITQPANLTATSSQTNVTCFGGSDGIASVTPSGGTSPYTYSWTSSSSTLSTASSLSLGNYTVTIKDNKNCVATKTFAITQGTAVTISVNSGTICSGKTFTMVPTGANTYTYQGGSASVSPTTSTNYTVQGSDALGCVSNIVTSSVTVNASPNVTITPSNTISCSADNLTLTAGGAATYLWSNGTTTTAAWVISPNANTTRTVVGTAANGCTNQAVQSISVIPSPTITLVPSSTVVCSADMVTLTVSGASTYTWSNSLGNATLVTVTSTSNYTRSVTATAANGCTDSASQAILVNTSPTVAIIPSSTVVCSANTVTLTTSGASTYTWSNSLGNATLVTVSSANNYTRTVTGT
ncbi:MAG: SprB repeat-containing protein, partial [Bacteroidia bacterium]|nr:SprB repeat-containing protein [Bacteroidia bacterium]